MYILQHLLQAAYLVAICYPVSSWGLLAYPKLVPVEHIRNTTELNTRTPKVAGSIVIPLYQEAGHTTWVGFRRLPGLFGTTVSDEAVRETARKTFNSIENSFPWSMTRAILAVIYVPGGGWAAGTIWHGSETGFQTYAHDSSTFWDSVPGNDQGLVSGTQNTHAWHAEAVAVAKAEKEFRDTIQDRRWPANTKIYVYGKENGKDAGTKAVCVPGHTSVKKSCGEWLDNLQIYVVPSG